MDKYIGKKVDGRYEIREMIGIGGMANVYKAYDVIEERIVAVKILRDEFAANEEFLRRFKNESKAISLLNHPNIVKVYDVSFSDRMNSIVMEYIDGITLKEYIEHQKVLRYREAVHFTVQILRALQHAHDKGIVHRDIKPQNIMLLRDATIKITDFGIARFSRSETRTLTEKAIGSVHYISPEQASGAEIDARTDIYSVGVMLYEMLTGRVPFEADTPVSVAIKQIQSPIVKPREINPEIPEGLEEIVLKATQKDVNYRYQSAAQMLEGIAEFKRNPSISFEYKYLQEPSAAQRTARQEQESMRKTSNSTTKKSTYVQQSGEKAPVQKAFPVLPVLAGISFAFALVAVLFIAMLVIINDPLAEVPEITAPDLVGQEYQTAARNRDYRDQVVIEVEETQFNSDYPEGVIFKQQPAGGKTIKQGATIRVKVSAGVQTVILPDYSGQEATEVYKKLREQGLDYDEFMIFSDTIADGYVVKTDPERKSEIQSGEMVTVYVSRGPQDRNTRIPDVAGMNFDEAKALLASYKLRVSYVNEVRAPDDEEPGVVLEQYPEADTEVREGSAVELTIVRGYLNYDNEENGSDSNGEKNTVQVTFTLPGNIDEVVEIGAYDGNKKVVGDELNPKEAREWIVNFKGSGKREITLRVEDTVYSIYEVDFDNGTYRQV